MPERGRHRIIQQRRNNFCSILLYVFMRELFSPHTFRAKTLVRIEQANTILAAYAGQGFVSNFCVNCSTNSLRASWSRIRNEIMTDLGDTLVNARNAGARRLGFDRGSDA